MAKSAEFRNPAHAVVTGPHGRLAERVAVVGGDGRASQGGSFPASARHFVARRYGGNGPLRSLVQALQVGAFERVFILARWNSHSTTRRVLRLCRQLGVPVQVIP